jgi:hypothetical protein
MRRPAGRRRVALALGLWAWTAAACAARPLPEVGGASSTGTGPSSSAGTSAGGSSATSSASSHGTAGGSPGGSSSGGRSVAASTMGGSSGSSAAGDPCLAPVPDSGPCFQDIECPPGSYCDFAMDGGCSVDGMGVFSEGGPVVLAIAGSCLPACGATGSPCQVGEDCPESEWCLNVIDGGNVSIFGACTAQTPCNGQCTGSAVGDVPCQSPILSAYACPSWCVVSTAPHAIFCASQPPVVWCNCQTCPEVTPDSGPVGCVFPPGQCSQDSDCCGERCFMDGDAGNCL